MRMESGGDLGNQVDDGVFPDLAALVKAVEADNKPQTMRSNVVEYVRLSHMNLKYTNMSGCDREYTEHSAIFSQSSSHSPPCLRRGI